MVSLELREVLFNILIKIEKGTAETGDALAIYDNMANRLRHVQRKSNARKRACRDQQRALIELQREYAMEVEAKEHFKSMWYNNTGGKQDAS